MNNMKRPGKMDFPLITNDYSLNNSIKMPDSNGNGPNNVLIQKLGTNVGMGRISCSHGDERR